MNRTLAIFCLAIALGGCRSAPNSHQLTTAQWDSTATQDVRAQVEKTMAAFASMNADSFKAGLAEDVSGFEVDFDGKPVRLASREEAVRFAEATFAQLKKMGASAKLDIHANDCHATPTLAYCSVEFDFKAMMADGNTMSQPTRNTVVLRKGDDGWKWIHWHSSPAVAATPQPEAATKAK